MENKLKAENLNDSKKQALCNQMEVLVEKLDEKNTELIRITRPEVRTQEFVIFSDFRSHYQDLIKLYRHSKDCGNQTSLVLSTSAVDKELKKDRKWYRKWSNRKRWGERRGLFQAFC